MGFRIAQEEYDRLVREGVIVEPGSVKEIPQRSGAKHRGRTPKPPLLPASFASPATFTVPVRVFAGDNSRSLGAQIGRKGHERTACCRVFATQHRVWAAFVDLLAAGVGVRVTLTRLGGRKMDASNVVAAFKFVQDCCADWLGVDDADPRIEWRYGQKPGGDNGVEVRLEREDA